MSPKLVLIAMLLAGSMALVTAGKQSRSKMRAAAKDKASLIAAFQCEACRRKIAKSETKGWVEKKVKEFQTLEAKYWNETEAWDKKVKSGKFTARMRSRQSIHRSNTTVNSRSPARRGYTYFPGQGNYKLYNINTSSFEAQKQCQEDGADLTVINSNDEAQVLKSLIDRYPIIITDEGDVFNIGVRKKKGEGNIWYTVFGDDFRNVGFNHWEAINPIMPDPNKDSCMTFNRNGELHEHTCGCEVRFICEHLIKTIDEDCLGDPPAPRGYMHFPGHGNYKLYTKAQQWSRALEICENDGGSLAVVNSDDESQVLKTLMTHYPTMSGAYSSAYIFIGATRIGNDFITVFGDNIRDLAFNRWASGEPRMNKPEHCVTLTRNAELCGVRCHYTYGFICENYNRDLKETYMINTKKP